MSTEELKPLLISKDEGDFNVAIALMKGQGYGKADIAKVCDEAMKGSNYHAELYKADSEGRLFWTRHVKTHPGIFIKDPTRILKLRNG